METTPTLTDDQAEALKQEALIPEMSSDTVLLGDRRCQVRLLPFKIERQVIAMLKPHLGAISTLQAGGIETLAGLIDAASELLPKLVAAAYAHAGVTEEWLEENSNTKQMLEAVAAQLAKNGMADLLGNTWLPRGRAG